MILIRPVTEWWKITHEIAHVVYDLLYPPEALEESIYAYIEQVYEGSQASAERVINEIFANWFDWKYIFRQETQVFLTSIWSSWLTFSFVWEQQKQYLVRSFAIYVCRNYADLNAAAQAGRRADHLLPFLREEWKGFSEILNKIDKGHQFLGGLSESFVNDVIFQVASLVPLLQFFQERYEAIAGLRGLEERLNPPYPNLAAHLDCLMRGEVITDEILNPCRLQLELLKRATDQKPPLATEIAYIPTFFLSRTRT